MSRLVLIDGHALLHRAFHAYPPLTTSKGELINAVYGFTSILLTVLRELGPKYVAVAFDLPKPTFRHKKFDGYKATRPETPKDLTDQIGRVHQVVETLNIPIFEVEGFEADDVIGTLALQAGKCEVGSGKCEIEIGSGIEVIIVTGDRDALQLINNKVKVYLPARGKKPAEIIDRKEFIKKYQFEPRQLVDLKALAGDPSDDIPGVSGIGPKTATDLILKFGDFRAIYRALGVELDGIKATLSSLKSTENTEKLRKFKKSIRKKLLLGIESAKMSHELAKIVTDVPIKLNLKTCKLHDYDKDRVLKLFEELEFKSLIKKLPDDDWESMVRNTVGGRTDGKKATLRTLNLTDTENTENKKSEQMGLF